MYSEQLAQRLRAVLADVADVVEKRMFGGVAFMVRGNLACGVHQHNLIVRLGASQAGEALSQPHVVPLALTGKPMANWVMVEPGGCQTEADLKRWVSSGVEYATSLPAK